MNNELNASINSLYLSWTKALNDVHSISDPQSKRDHYQYLQELIDYAKNLQANAIDDQLTHQSKHKLHYIVQRPLKHHVVQTKHNAVVVK